MTSFVDYDKHMQQIIEEMRQYPDDFDLSVPPRVTIIPGHLLGMSGRMVSMSVNLKLPVGATEYIRKKPYVCVWIESVSTDAATPRIEVGTGPIYFDIENIHSTFASAVKNMRLIITGGCADEALING